MAATVEICRVRARVGGTVQGVGFRPFVYRLARDLALGGWVRNDERGVELEVEGARDAVGAFLTRLRPQAPPRANVADVSGQPLQARGARGLQIVASTGPRGDAD
ncbi:MAG: hydrogenase maturation protein HypF, partial [Solirubrobacteraceae bacterium]|nr:hydrogenase maturation protein HypF [Solirubrobacteraceae bacterium]